MKIRSLKILALTMLIINSGVTWAASCEGYPYYPSADTQFLSDGKFKILATDQAKAAFDDVDVIGSARDEAELLAKARLAKYVEENFSSDESIAKVIEKGAQQTGQGASDTFKATTQELKKLGTHSQMLLRGVVLLGECYDPSKKLLRVTVGLKSESIAQGGNVADALSQSLSSHQTMKQSPPNSGNNPNNIDSPMTNEAPASQSGGSDGYNHTELLKNF